MKKEALVLFLTLQLSGIALAERQHPAKIDIYKDLPYVAEGHERQRLDLYVPTDRDEGSFPLIVWIHGGAWKYGSKEHCPVMAWTDKGYVIASINYRLSHDARFPAQIEDCKAAVYWLKANARSYKINPGRVVAWGESAGGHLAALLGTAGDVPEWEEGRRLGSSRVQVVIDWYGRADLRRVGTDPAMAASPVAMLLGGSGEKMAKFARKASPIMYVSKDDPPFLIMHGDQDNTVPLQQSLSFAGALRETGVAVRLVVLKGAGHGGMEFMQPEQVNIIDAFLETYLLQVPEKAE